MVFGEISIFPSQVAAGARTNMLVNRAAGDSLRQGSLEGGRTRALVAQPFAVKVWIVRAMDIDSKGWLVVAPTERTFRRTPRGERLLEVAANVMNAIHQRITVFDVQEGAGLSSSRRSLEQVSSTEKCHVSCMKSVGSALKFIQVTSVFTSARAKALGTRYEVTG